MAAEDQAVSEKVQNYLDKHKISSLFEDLKSKIIKDLPLDPIDFLLTKLQALHKQKKKGVSTLRPATSSGVPSSRSRIQVTGTSVSPAPASKSSSAVKSQTGLSSKSLTKTPARPASKATAGSRLSPSTSAPSTPKRPTSAPTTGKSSSPSPSKSAGVKSPSKLSTSSSASSAVKTTPAKPRPGSKPPSTSGPSKPAAGTSKKTATTPANKDKSKPLPKKTVDTQAAKKAPAKEKPGPTKKETTKKVEDFIEEAQKSSAEREDDNGELSVPSVGVEESDSDGSVRGEEGDACDCLDVSLESLLKQKMSKKQEKNKRSPKKTKPHLYPKPAEDEVSITPPSLGYHSESGDGCGESEEDECVEAVEDLTALEDEGVTGLAGKQSVNLPKDAQVDFVVLLCARCAKMLTGDEPKAEMSAIVVTKGAASDFESASQVGSQASFPQWEVETEADSEASSVNKWASSSDTSTNITLVSRDTWGGPAPKTVPTTSEEDSEVQLPPPPPLEGQPWREESPHPHDPHGWGTAEASGDTENGSN